jgi:predicted Zn-dependent protease
LVHIDGIPGESEAKPSLLTLLQAYGQLGVDHREYMQRYFAVAQQLESAEPNNINVLEALASSALQERTAEAEARAMDYLARAIEQGSTSAWDFEQLGTHLLRAQRPSDALACLQKGVQRAPYDAKLYALLAAAYAALNRPQDSAATLHEALQRFPQLDFLRALLNNVEEASPGSQGIQRQH